MLETKRKGKQTDWKQLDGVAMHVMYHNISAYSSWSVFSVKFDSADGFVNVPICTKQKQRETESRNNRNKKRKIRWTD